MYIGIDPGQHSAWAIVDERFALIDAGEVRYDLKRHELATTVVLRLSSLYTLKMACLEDQYVGENKHSALSLARNAGRWMEACDHAGVPLVLVSASEWQSAELGLRSRASREERKGAAAARCRGLWRVQASEHVCDAALMARWLAVEDSRRAHHGA